MRLPGECAVFADGAGSEHPHTLDCLVRHLQETGWAGALALGHDPDAGEMVTEAGIGRLRLTPTTAEFTPARQPGPQAPDPQPLPAPPDLAAKRRERCLACPSWADRCTVAGCSCAGLGMAERLLSRCPTGRWD